MSDLTEREKSVLDAIVRDYILTSNPVASQYIATAHRLPISPATIRNTMARLEEKGYIYQPHPSAGRVPTTSGYRLYVDLMMSRTRLSRQNKERIRKAVGQNPGDFESLLKEASRILAHLSNQLSVIITPRIEEGLFHRIDITRLDSGRLLLIVSIKSGLVKTIVLELNSRIRTDQLDMLSQILNERLHGLRLKEIRSRFREIVQDIQGEESGLIRLFIDTATQIFNFSENKDVYVTGTHHMLRQPEFMDNQKISSVVELLENKRIIIHLLDREDSPENINIAIGEEIGEQEMNQCSIISARYRIGEVMGTLGIIGPMRMNYSHIIPLVDFTAYMLSHSMESN